MSGTFMGIEIGEMDDMCDPEESEAMAKQQFMDIVSYYYDHFNLVEMSAEHGVIDVTNEHNITDSLTSFNEVNIRLYSRKN